MTNLAHRRGIAEAPDVTAPIYLSEVTFWNTAANNSLDICVQNFSKIFVERKRTEKHHWRKVVRNHDAFVAGLLRTLKLNEAEYCTYLKSMQHYRDQFIAHLDDERKMHPPELEAAKSAVQFLHAWIIDNEAMPGLLDVQIDTAQKLLTAYEIERETAKRVYRRNCGKPMVNA
jgi:hypothetical protein